MVFFRNFARHNMFINYNIWAGWSYSHKWIQLLWIRLLFRITIRIHECYYSCDNENSNKHSALELHFSNIISDTFLRSIFCILLYIKLSLVLISARLFLLNASNACILFSQHLSHFRNVFNGSLLILIGSDPQ